MTMTTIRRQLIVVELITVAKVQKSDNETTWIFGKYVYRTYSKTTSNRHSCGSRWHYWLFFRKYEPSIYAILKFRVGIIATKRHVPVKLMWNSIRATCRKNSDKIKQFQAPLSAFFHNSPQKLYQNQQNLSHPLYFNIDGAPGYSSNYRRTSVSNFIPNDFRMSSPNKHSTVTHIFNNFIKSCGIYTSVVNFRTVDRFSIWSSLSAFYNT